MKFKKGDTVYLKADVLSIDNDFERCDIAIKNTIRNLAVPFDELYTKQEMLEELQKPEMPKVGEVWQCEDEFKSILGKFKITYIDNDINQIVVKGADRELRIIKTEFMLKHCKKVESMSKEMPEFLKKEMYKSMSDIKLNTLEGQTLVVGEMNGYESSCVMKGFKKCYELMSKPENLKRIPEVRELIEVLEKYLRSREVVGKELDWDSYERLKNYLKPFEGE